MQFTFLFQAILATSLVSSGTNAERHDADVYAKFVAPALLQRIASYREGRGNDLTSAQTKVLDDAVRIINGFEFDQVDALKVSCAAAFGKEHCAAIFKDGRKRTQSMPGILGRRTVLCDCTDEDDDCDGGVGCAYHSDNCGFYSKFSQLPLLQTPPLSVSWT